MELLEGREMKIEVNENLECEKEGKTQEKRRKQKLGEEEIKKSSLKMKKKKAARIDGIPVEAWIYAGAGIQRELVGVLKQICVERGSDSTGLEDAQCGSVI